MKPETRHAFSLSSVALAGLLLAGGCASTAESPALWRTRESPLVCAHRGSRAEYDDNAAGGFAKSLAAGVRGFETDVRMTTDDELVIMHDVKVERTTTGTGRVDQMTKEQVTALTLKRSGEHVPTPAIIAEIFRGVKDVRIEWEMKESVASLGQARADLYCDKLYAVVTSTMEPGTYVFTSFSDTILATMKRRHPDAPTGYITGKPLTQDFIDQAVALGCCGVAPALKGTTREAVDAAHAKGLVVTLWMVQKPDTYAKARALGADVCTSDYAMAVRAAAVKANR